MSSKETLDINSAVARNEGIIFSNMDEETVMMSIEKGEYYGVNPVGRRIWELLETPVTVSAMCDTLCGEYNIEPEQCSKDVLAFLEQLSAKDVIKVVDG